MTSTPALPRSVSLRLVPFLVHRGTIVSSSTLFERSGSKVSLVTDGEWVTEYGVVVRATIVIVAVTD
jgi:hypothetical protein